MYSAHAEKVRVTEHLQRAETFAATRDISALPPVRALIRELLLGELAGYREAGRFPRNPGFAELTPTFVDDVGTRCAMAHLLELGGEQDLVAKIARERNYARVKELADEPRLLAWLEAAGLTVEEAAVIQPGYGCTSAAECVCRQGFSSLSIPVPSKAVLEATVTATSTARVDAVYGTSNFHVGDLIEVQSFIEVGKRVVIGLDEQQAQTVVAAGGVTQGSFPSVTLDPSGRYQCSATGGTNAPPIAPADLARVVTSSNCVAEARTLSGFEAACSSSRQGCTVAGGDPTSLGVLLAIVGALLARRR